MEINENNIKIFIEILKPFNIGPCVISCTSPLYGPVTHLN